MAEFGVDVYGGETYAGEPSSVVPITTFPSLLFEEAFTTIPLAETPVFVDLGADNVRAFTATQNSRSSELDRSSVGSLQVTVDAKTSGLDSTNPDSPYAPYVTPNTRVRFRIVADNITYPISEGFADSHNMRYEMPAEAYCDLVASDAFKILARAPLAGMPARPKERADVRVTAILDWVGWPASRRAVSPARTILIAEDISDRAALDALQQIDDTEVGRLTVNPEGVLVFLSRIDMQNAERQTVPQATFSDDYTEGTIPYQSPLILDNGESFIRNIVEITHPTGDPIVISDDASVDLYGPLSFQREVRDVAATARRATAEHFLTGYSQPFTRVLSLTVLTSDYPPSFPTGMYGQMATLRVGDRVTFEQHMGRTTPFVQDCFIESKSDTAAPTDKLWMTSVGLSHAPPVVTGSQWGTGQWGTAKWTF